MKIKLIATSIILVILSVFIIPTATSIVEASTGLGTNELIIVNGNTITKTTTISQVNNMFGTPKLETQTAFGGKAYSYTDSSLSYYLHIETNSNGEIKSYGAIGGNFKARSYAYDDIADSYYSKLSGTVLYEFSPRKVYGIFEYNVSRTEEAEYYSRFQKNASNYLYDLQKHSILASQVIAKRFNQEFVQTYSSEDIFYRNEQLKENGSNFYDYSRNNGKTSYVSLISASSGAELYAYLPNPVWFGDYIEGYPEASNYQYMMYDFEMTDYTNKKYAMRAYYIDPDILETKNTVSLTQEEKDKLAAAQVEYNKFVTNFNAIADEVYITKSNSDTLPLTVGTYKTEALQMATDFLNVARAGLGLQTLTLDTDIANAAEHKAVLVRYMTKQGMSAGHNPSKPDGVSNEFYQKAQSYMSENLYMGNIQSSIINALNDGYGDPITCGHRYNLLDPSYQKWGVASCEVQGVHKFSGYSSNTADLVAWPSNGIMPIDLINVSIGNWTAKFYNNYKVTADTEVTIKCLNNNKTYVINKQNASESSKLLQVEIDSNLVAFRDDTISYENGDVFEITLSNIKNNSTGALENYVYRSVFHTFYDSASSSVTDISLSTQSVKLAKGGTLKVNATIVPSDAENKLMDWKSNNENIAKVRQDGTIQAIETGKTTITVTCGYITKTINVEVQETLKGDVNLDGNITLADYTKILAHVKKTQLLTGSALKAADVNGDQNVTLADYTKVLAHVKKTALLY